jgi:hypothetical protein
MEQYRRICMNIISMDRMKRWYNISIIMVRKGCGIDGKASKVVGNSI